MSGMTNKKPSVMHSNYNHNFLTLFFYPPKTRSKLHPTARRISKNGSPNHRLVGVSRCMKHLVMDVGRHGAG